MVPTRATLVTSSAERHHCAVMPAAEIAREVARYTLGPGWSMYVYEHPYEGPYVCWEGHVPDGYEPDRTSVVKIRSAVPPVRDGDALKVWLLWRWLIISSHEAREMFRYDGALVADPHSPTDHA